MSRDRKGCCEDWPKPCSYHEGFQDAIDTISEAQERVVEAARPLAHCFTPVDRPATPEEVDDGCELGIWFDPCGHCSGCRLAAALEALR